MISETKETRKAGKIHLKYDVNFQGLLWKRNACFMSYRIEGRAGAANSCSTAVQDVIIKYIVQTVN
jgi:hypothetical protein